MDPQEAGCLSQRSQLERLREIADGWAKDRLVNLDASANNLGTALIVLRADSEPGWDARELGVAPGVHGPADWPPTDPHAALSQFIPVQSIMRILRATPANAAALITPFPSAMMALQIADFDHEESLTARIIRQPDASPTLGKWDFANVTWSVRLRQMLRGARGGAGAARPTRAATASVPAKAPKLEPAGQSRRQHVRELREQLGQEPAAAPSWLQ
jgi:hypothetical protein